MSEVPPAPPGPPPGWFADPWRQAAFRWWDGQSWTPEVRTPPGAGRRFGLSIKTVLIATGALSLGWAALWALLLPALLINDADNNRLGHDLNTLWFPQIALGVVSAVSCLIAFLAERWPRRPRIARWLPLAVCPAAAIVAALLIPNGNR